MSEDADIDNQDPSDETVKPARHVGFKTLALGVLIAAILGAGGGAMLSKTLQKPAVDISPLRTNIETLQSENKTLKAQVTRLQRDIKALPQPAAIDMTGIESRLALLENAKPQDIDQDLVARLEALNEKCPEALDLSDITVRIEALENRAAANVRVKTAPTETASEPFPEAAIFKVLDKSNPAGGWFKRSLKKHISVQSEDNPHYLVELIVQNIEDGNIEAALSAFDKLPAEAKAAGAQWRESLVK